MSNVSLTVFTLIILLVRTVAEEADVCAGLGEQAAGLCKGFCLAQKCHINPTNGNGCNSLRENFFKATGETLFPCETPASTVGPTLSPTESPTVSPTVSPTDAPSTSSPTSDGYLNCPCWANKYLETVVNFFLAGNLLPFRFSSSMGPEDVAHADVGSHETFLQNGLRLSAGEDETSSTGYYCTDWDNDAVKKDVVLNPDYLACENDILLIMNKFAPLGNICKLNNTGPIATECPCWVTGLPVEASILQDSFSSEYHDPSHLKEAYFTLLDGTSETDYNVTAFADQTYSCSKTSEGESMILDDLTEAEFKKCYNDALRKSYDHGSNLCAAYRP